MTCTAKWGPDGRPARGAKCGEPATRTRLARESERWDAELCPLHLAYFTGPCRWRVVNRLEVVR